METFSPDLHWASTGGRTIFQGLLLARTPAVVIRNTAGPLQKLLQVMDMAFLGPLQR